MEVFCQKEGECAEVKRIERLIASKCEAIIGDREGGLGGVDNQRGVFDRKRKPRRSETLSRLGALVSSY